ncbi:MAG: hypothetical protein LBI13_06290 [Streptococcaceae bacterium]|jgi:hypothetical protein|nr:hypothetical protein [Streptococcaceae bacterium]
MDDETRQCLLELLLKIQGLVFEFGEIDDHSRALLRQSSNNYRDILSDLVLGVHDYIIQSLDENGEGAYKPPERFIRLWLTIHAVIRTDPTGGLDSVDVQNAIGEVAIGISGQYGDAKSFVDKVDSMR